MTIKSTYRLGGDIMEVIIKGKDIMFSDDTGMITTIDGLKLSKAGVIEEFPDLKDKKNWREEGLKRFKAHLKSISGEMGKTNYVKDELSKSGYEPMFYQPAGWRPKKFK